MGKISIKTKQMRAGKSDIDRETEQKSASAYRHESRPNIRLAIQNN